MLRKIAIWIVKNLFILLLITLIFSTAALDMPALINGLFTDIFQYSSPEMQKEVVSELTSACSDLDKKSLGNLLLTVDFKKIGALCNDYKGGKINDKEFFFDVIGTALSGQFEMQKYGPLQKYNASINFLGKNKVIYFLVLLVLLASLYLLIGDIEVFIVRLTGISFSMGILILLPYAAIIVYNKFAGIDTTPILSSILQANFSLNVKAIISVMLLMILRTYTSLIIASGIIFLGVGVAGKIYIWELRKQSKEPEPKAEKNPEKGGDKKNKEIKKETELEADKNGRGRKRTTNEILEELEEIHKKRMKEKERES